MSSMLLFSHKAQPTLLGGLLGMAYKALHSGSPVLRPPGKVSAVCHLRVLKPEMVACG